MGCNSFVGTDFKIIFDLMTEFHFHNVEVSSTMNSKDITFKLQDIDHSDMPPLELQALALRVDNYLAEKYDRIKNSNPRVYILNGAGGFQEANFTIDNTGIEVNNINKQYSK